MSVLRAVLTALAGYYNPGRAEQRPAGYLLTAVGGGGGEYGAITWADFPVVGSLGGRRWVADLGEQVEVVGVLEERRWEGRLDDRPERYGGLDSNRWEGRLG